MNQRKRAFTARKQQRSSESALAASSAANPDDLYATLYEQTQQVLGGACGFYVAAFDAERDQVRLVYLHDDALAIDPGDTFDAAACDVIAARCPIINDTFARRVSDNVVNSISVPVIRNGIVWGAIGAFSRAERAYDARDAKALGALAKLSALVLEHASFVGAIQKARREAERLEEIGRAITASLNVSQVLERVVSAAIELIGADAATVWLVRGEHEVEAAMSAGEIAPKVGTVLPVPPALRRRMTELGKPFLLYDDVARRAERDPLIALPQLAPAASTLAVALMADDDVLGALSIAHRQPIEYGPADIQLLERLSYQAAIAVANARLHERLHALSLTDPLTEMPNRRHLALFLEKEFAAAKRGRHLAALLFDLDRFKDYNDRTGHQAGDAVLRAFARVLLDNTRAMNLAARYGGDEFIAILGDTDENGAIRHSERILEEVGMNPVLSAAGIHASVGIALYDQAMLTYEDLIRAADRDLYRRKGARRNRSA